jgi:hypothetical protein
MNDEAALPGGPDTTTRALDDTTARGAQKPTTAELLSTPGAMLSRTHLRELGYERRAVDAIFQRCPVVAIPGYSRPMVKVSDYLELLERSTFRGDRVRA